MSLLKWYKQQQFSIWLAPLQVLLEEFTGNHR